MTIVYMTIGMRIIFISTTLIGLSESPKKTLFKNLILEIIEVKFSEKSKQIIYFPRLWPKLKCHSHRNNRCQNRACD